MGLRGQGFGTFLAFKFSVLDENGESTPNASGHVMLALGWSPQPHESIDICYCKGSSLVPCARSFSGTLPRSLVYAIFSSEKRQCPSTYTAYALAPKSVPAQQTIWGLRVLHMGTVRLNNETNLYLCILRPLCVYIYL